MSEDEAARVEFYFYNAGLDKLRQMSRRERQSDEELQLSLENADYMLRQRSDGGLWRHRKTGGEYVVLFTALEESTCRVVVVYRARDILVTDKPIWTRPLQEFLDRFDPVLPTNSVQTNVIGAVT